MTLIPRWLRILDEWLNPKPTKPDTGMSYSECTKSARKKLK